MDNFKKLIDTHRAAFDTEMPPLTIWHQIEKQLPKPERKINPTTRVWQVAAAIAILGIGIGFGLFISNIVKPKVDEAIVKNNPPDFEEAKTYYTEKINQSVTQLVSFKPDSMVLKDVEDVDAFQRELYEELRNAPESAREEIVKRIINAYQIKLGILEHVLERVKNAQSRAPQTTKNNYHEGI